MMANEKENFLSVLRCAVHHLPVQLTAPVDYKEILALAAEQNLQAVICEKLCESEAFRKSSLFNEAVSATIGTVGGQASRTAAFLDLYCAITDAGGRPIVMKGIICRQLYGDLHDHRPSGDEDILIKKEDLSAQDLQRELRHEDKTNFRDHGSASLYCIPAPFELFSSAGSVYRHDDECV